MNLKKTILAVLAAFIISNLLTTLWYMITDDANFVSFRRDEMNYGGLMLNHLIYSGLFVFLFSPFYKRKPTMGNAFLYGVLMGAVMFIPTGIVVRSIWTVDFNGIFLLNSVAHAVISGVMGIAVAFVYNFRKED